MPKKLKPAKTTLDEMFDLGRGRSINVGRAAASVNPAASAWTREQKIEKLSVVIAATMDALELSPRVRLKILADCAERIKSGSIPPLRRTPDKPK